jgi:acetate kinase
VKILVINGGSSNVKCWFRDVPDGPLPEEPLEPDWETRVELRQQGSSGLEAVLQSFLKEHARSVDVVGHRIVHGGRAYRETTLITPEVKAAIAQQAEFAPTHNRLELDAIEMAGRVFGPATPQVAVFDTEFHATLAPAAYVYPGPYTWLEQGIRRYGFHGISHRYAARRAAHILGRELKSLRLVICHLGNGCSLAAVRGGESVDTTMGFTPLEGLAMGTRSGSIDPGILIYLLRHKGYTADQLDRVLNQESGLKGLSGLSGDMRETLAAMDDGNSRARLAFDVYAHRLCQEVGAMLGVVGGIDALVFTGGVGENCAPLRDIVCRQFGFLGMKLDTEANADSPRDRDIATRDSTVRILLIRAQEEWEIARECYRLAPR